MIVVTGAAGHAGANLVRTLAAEGRPVRALVHLDRKALEGLDIEVVTGDICDIASLRKAFEGAEVVYHLAACIAIANEPWSLLESVNISGTHNVVEACLNCGVRRLVHFSTIHTLVDTPGVPVDESNPLVDSRRYLPYDRSKAAAEGEIQRGIEKGLDAIIVIPTAIIGPHDYKPSYLGEALIKLANGQLPALVSGGFNWVDVRDIVGGAMRAEKVAPTGAKYLLSGHWVSLRQLAKMIEEISGVKAPASVYPMWLARIGAPFVTAFDLLARRRPLYTSASLQALRGHRHISHRKATRELDYHPRPFRETLIDTLRWFEAAGKLERPLKLKKAAKI